VRALGIAVVLCLGPISQLAGQVAVYFGVGPRYSGTLVHDSIVTAFDVRQAAAPVFTVGIELPPHRGWSAGAALDFSRSRLQRHDADGSIVDLDGLSALSFTVSLRRELATGLGARLAVGGVRYVPPRDEGIFASGAGSPLPLLGIAVDWAPGVARARALTLEVRADAHRFLTRALQDDGFTEHRLVPRVSGVVRVDLMRLW